MKKKAIEVKEETKSHIVDLFNMTSQEEKYFDMSLWFSCWRDEDFVFTNFGYTSLCLPINDFIVLANTMKLIADGIEGCIPSHAEKYIREKFLEWSSKKEDIKIPE